MQKKAISYLLSAVGVLSVLMVSSSAANADSAQVYLKNGSSFTAMLQVKDEVCKQSPDTECEYARTLLASRECAQNPFSAECKAARITVDSACSCEQARTILREKNCLEQPSSPECKQAGNKLDSSSCQEGIIFEGSVERGEKIVLTICLSPAGFGQIAVKDGKNAYWTSYHLIHAEDTLTYH